MAGSSVFDPAFFVFDAFAVSDALIVCRRFDALRASEDGSGAEDMSGMGSSSLLFRALMSHLESHAGAVVLLVTSAKSLDMVKHLLPSTLIRSVQRIVEFKMPDAACRTRLWKRMLPDKTPVVDDIDFDELGRELAASIFPVFSNL